MASLGTLQLNITINDLGRYSEEGNEMIQLTFWVGQQSQCPVKEGIQREKKEKNHQINGYEPSIVLWMQLRLDWAKNDTKMEADDQLQC